MVQKHFVTRSRSILHSCSL